MAISTSHQYFHPLLNPTSSFSFSSKFHTNFPPFHNPFNFKPQCSQNSIQTKTQQPNIDLDTQKKKRKPRPSFHDQIREKWSVKPVSHTKKYPWQIQKEEEQLESSVSESEMVGNHKVSDFTSGNCVSLVESSKLDDKLIVGSEIEEPGFEFKRNVDQSLSNSVGKPVNCGLDNDLVRELTFGDDVSLVESSKLDDNLIDGSEIKEPGFEFKRNVDQCLSNLVSEPVNYDLDNDLVSDMVGNHKVRELASKNDVFVVESSKLDAKLTDGSEIEKPGFGFKRNVDPSLSVSVSEPVNSSLDNDLVSEMVENHKVRKLASGKYVSLVESSKLDDNFFDGSEIEEPGFEFKRNVDQCFSNSVSEPVNYGLDNDLVSDMVENYKVRELASKNDVSVVESAKLSSKIDRSKTEEANFGANRDVDRNSSNRVSEHVGSSFDNVLLSSSDVEKKKLKETELDVVKFGGNLVKNLVSEKLVECESNVKGNVGTVSVQEDSKVILSHSEYDVGISGNSWNTKTRSENVVRERSKDRLPWVAETDSEKTGKDGQKKKKTELAEKLVPEHELKRLRNIALRMKERLKVGAAGVTQAVVDAIHEKWKIDEVVKLKFEGPSILNMKRIHDVLESKTGGLVIWRSGSSVVLFRGVTYELDCVQTYKEEKKVNSDISHHQGKRVPDSVRLPKKLSEEESVRMSELNNLLDELGPRYVDWSGPPPLPVDADLLPGVVPGYRTPFRLLPYGVRRGLRDVETTEYRRLARISPPHFALGRSRELQGLAAAMVKLWEKSAIAKIAIKRGVLFTSNDRMAEELKRLTRGTLLSRNKEYIVFYRGNDFLPPNVKESLKEREQLSMLQYQEEEDRRNASALITSNVQNYKVPMVAGTLAETVAATSRWGKQPDNEDVEKMMKESALARRASLITYLKKKLAIANEKLKKAGEALEKVQGYLEPEELPTDSETITDEERLVFRKMGLSMKPFLLVGRREVFDGTIENIHMHWKFRELVKVIVRGKNFAQVKHVAIFLEAESGGVLVSIDRTTKGYAIIIYRGKNYRQPVRLRPRNLLTRRQALARSIELQRREGLKHHISSLQEQMELLNSEIEDTKDGKEIDDKTFYAKLDDSSIPSDDEMEEDEDEEAYLQTYDSGDENGAFSDAELSQDDI